MPEKEWLQEWRDDLMTVCDIMDRTGRRTDGGAGMVLWKEDWYRIRRTLQSVADSIQEQRRQVA